jgi:hypothetical protein
MNPSQNPEHQVPRLRKLLFTGGLAFILLAPAYAFFVVAFTPVKGMPVRINCLNNLKQIGLAFKTWAIDNHDLYPFNAPTNTGGTLELCARGADGFDTNAAFHFQVMSNELSTPKILVCPKDPTRKVAANFGSLTPQQVTYRMRSGTNIRDDTPNEILVICPIHSNLLRSDGSVTVGMPDPPESGWERTWELAKWHPPTYSGLLSSLALLVTGVLFVWLSFRIPIQPGRRLVEAALILIPGIVLIAYLCLFAYQVQHHDTGLYGTPLLVPPVAQPRGS